MLRLLFWVKNLSKGYFLGQPIMQLLFWVYEMPSYFLVLELGKRVRNQEKYDLDKKLDLFLPIRDENYIITRVFTIICEC